MSERSSLPRILLLDNSPRHLATSWFGRWFGGLDCHFSSYYFQRKSWSIDLNRFEALVISGSPASATEEAPWILQELKLIEQAGRQGMPILGVCFGAQLLARAYYGREAVHSSPQPEIGWYPICRTQQTDPIFEGIPQRFGSFQFHAEEVSPQPAMHVLAYSSTTAVQAFRVEDKPVWGLQFHLEVTPQAGRDLLRKTRKIYEPYGLRYEAMIAQARFSEAAPQLFRNFLDSI